MSIVSELKRIKEDKVLLKAELKRLLMDPTGDKLEDFISNLYPQFGDGEEIIVDRTAGDNGTNIAWRFKYLPDCTFEANNINSGDVWETDLPIEHYGNITVVGFIDNTNNNLFAKKTKLKRIESVTWVPSKDTESFENKALSYLFEKDPELEYVGEIRSEKPLTIKTAYSWFRESGPCNLPKLVNIKIIAEPDLFRDATVADWSNVNEYLENFNHTKSGLFYRCANLRTFPAIHVDHWSGIGYLFYYCYNLENIGDINAANATSANAVFYQSKFVGEARVGNLNLPKCTNYSSAFDNTSGIKHIGWLECSSVNRSINVLPFRYTLESFGGWLNFGKAFSPSLAANTNNASFGNSNDNIILDPESIHNVLTRLYDIASNGVKPQYVSITQKGLAMATEADLIEATNKGWTVKA